MTRVPKVGNYGTVWDFSHYKNRDDFDAQLPYSYKYMTKKYGDIFIKIETGFTGATPKDFGGLPIEHINKGGFKYSMIYVFDKDKLIELNKELVW